MQKLKNLLLAETNANFICVYASFACMQIWSCGSKAKFAQMSVYLNVLKKIVSRLEAELLLFVKCHVTPKQKYLCFIRVQNWRINQICAYANHVNGTLA